MHAIYSQTQNNTYTKNESKHTATRLNDVNYFFVMDVYCFLSVNSLYPVLIELTCR